MPKATLEFNLPDEQDEYTIATKAEKYLSVIYDFSTLLRNKTKYGDGKPVSWETVREEFHTLLNEEGIDPYEH